MTIMPDLSQLTPLKSRRNAAHEKLLAQFKQNPRRDDAMTRFVA
jgi:hypothetical protein